MKKPLVLIVVGSESDIEIMKEASAVLGKFGIPSETVIASAHRTPALVSELARKARGRGVEVIIAGAGMAAHLPGVIAAYTTIPVIGVPIPSSALGGLDSILSIVQMPSGIPVACVSAGKAGAVNSALLAVSILAVRRSALTRRIAAYRRGMARRIEQAQRKMAVRQSGRG